METVEWTVLVALIFSTTLLVIASLGSHVLSNFTMLQTVTQ